MFRRSFPGLTLLCAALLALPLALQAQWLVYELKLHPQSDSINFSTYQSGYLLAPANGGAASLILIADEDRHYAARFGAAKFFMAANALERRAAFSALATSGQSQALYAGSGPWNRSLVLANSAGTQQVLRVADTLWGSLLAADDESDHGPSADGSIGVLGSARIEGRLREDLSGLLSAGFAQQRQAFARLTELLEKYGYSPDEGAVESVAAEASAGMDASLFPKESMPRDP